MASSRWATSGSSAEVRRFFFCDWSCQAACRARDRWDDLYWRAMLGLFVFGKRLEELGVIGGMGRRVGEHFLLLLEVGHANGAEDVSVGVFVRRRFGRAGVVGFQVIRVIGMMDGKGNGRGS